MRTSSIARRSTMRTTSRPLPAADLLFLVDRARFFTGFFFTPDGGGSEMSR